MSFSHVELRELLIKSYINELVQESLDCCRPLTLSHSKHLSSRMMRSGSQSHQTWRAMASGPSLRAVAWNDITDRLSKCKSDVSDTVPKSLHLLKYYLRNDHSSLLWLLLSPCGPEVCAQCHRHSSCDRQGWLCCCFDSCSKT